MVYIKVADTQQEIDEHFANLPHNGIGKIRGSKTVEFEIKQTKEIHYTSTDGKIVKPTVAGFDVFGATLVSNTYDNGIGTITFKGYVKCIGNKAFSGNKTLETISIDGGLNYIGNNAFKNCTALKNVDFKKGVKRINDSAFVNCPLESIYIPASTSYIAENAFNCDINSTTSIVVEDGNLHYTSNSGNAIYDNETMTLIRGCDNTVMDENYCRYQLSTNAFSGCKNLKTAIISDKNKNVPSKAFYDCVSLQNVTFVGKTVTEIGDRAFYNCSSLTTISLPDSIQTFGVSSFEKCKKITELTISKESLMLSQNAFKGCSKLKRIVSPLADPPSLMYGVFDDTNNCPIYVPMDARARYAWEWNGYPNVVNRIVGF